eukprot:NODE_55_length_2744_cov_100.900267_g36_i0.p1 GENE.NODE_55_length_2744_cov_100.900267_g36_i0~~NODE_55_length_2744_cov_100.900267_g36_i0.p1  ORF type:complete len:853 (+),score=157.93 NODE_55_length_2744_cov_100.900267_g36_i0:103-2661(+)
MSRAGPWNCKVYYVDVQNDAAKIVTTYMFLVRQCNQRALVMCNTMDRAMNLHSALAEAFGANAAQLSGLPQATPIRHNIPCVVTGADGKPLAVQDARAYSTLILFDMPSSAGTFANWALNSHCQTAVCFLVAEPEAQQTRENAVLDDLETQHNITVNQWSTPCPPKEELLERANRLRAQAAGGPGSQNLEKHQQTLQDQLQTEKLTTQKWQRLAGEILSMTAGGAFFRPRPEAVLFSIPAPVTLLALWQSLEDSKHNASFSTDEPAPPIGLFMHSMSDLDQTPGGSVVLEGGFDSEARTKKQRAAEKRYKEAEQRITGNVKAYGTLLNGYNLNNPPPPDKLLLLWVNRVLLQVDPAAPICTNFSSDFQDLTPLIRLVKGLTGSSTIKVEKDMNRTSRAQWVLAELKDWLGYPLSVNPTELAEASEPDALLLILASLFDRFLALSERSVGLQSVGALELPQEDRDGDAVVSFVQNTTLQKLQQSLSGMLQNNEAWNTLAAINKQFMVTVASDRLQGRTLEQVEEAKLFRDQEQYVNFHPKRVVDIVLGVTNNNMPEKPADLAALDVSVTSVRQVLNKHVQELKKIFVFYANLDNTVDAAQGGAHVISSGEYWRFCLDAKLVNSGPLKKPILEKIFKKANANSDTIETSGELADAKEVDFGINPASELTPLEWVECLIRMAHVLYPQKPQLADRVKDMLEFKVLPNACSTNVDGFRQQIYKSHVQRVLAQYNIQLQRVFRFYAKVRTATDCDMSTAEFLVFLRECKLVDSTLNPPAVEEIFYTMQERGDEAAGGGEATMVYREFLEALVAVCTYKIPAPWIPLHDRLQAFFQKCLFPPLYANAKLKLRPPKQPT